MVKARVIKLTDPNGYNYRNDCVDKLFDLISIDYDDTLGRLFTLDTTELLGCITVWTEDFLSNDRKELVLPDTIIERLSKSVREFEYFADKAEKKGNYIEAQKLRSSSERARLRIEKKRNERENPIDHSELTPLEIVRINLKRE